MLFLIGSPIGNLGDITLRALDVLKEVAIIAAEDTRRSSILLKRFQISKPLISFHEHNEARRTSELIERLGAGEKVALLTDAGMPSISDPGYRLVRACIESGIRIEVIPGPSAVLTALVGSGLPTDRFYFGGFLPVKSGQRERELLAALARAFTSIYFESPYRIVRSLEVLRRADQVAPLVPRQVAPNPAVLARQRRSVARRARRARHHRDRWYRRAGR